MPNPLPTPTDNESKDAFVERCIRVWTDADPTRDPKQIAAICYEAWDSKRDKTVKQAEGMEVRAITVQPPHGRLIVEGYQTVLVLSEGNDNFLGRRYLLEGSLCYGILQLLDWRPITKEQFEQMRGKHQMTDEEMPAKPFLYTFKIVKAFVPPKKVKVEGSGHFIEKMEFVSNVGGPFPTNLTDAEIVDFHSIAHIAAERLQPGDQYHRLQEHHNQLTIEALDRDLVLQSFHDGFDDWCVLETRFEDGQQQVYTLLIKDPSHYDPAKEPTERLLDDHRIMHMMWVNMNRGYSMQWWNKQRLIEFHRRIVGELIRRFEEQQKPFHHWYRSDLDKESGVPYETPKSAKLFANVQPGNTVNFGTEVMLDQVLSALQDFAIKDPYVELVGGVAIHGHTTGDIDLLVHKSKRDSEFDVPLEFRICRQLPKELWNRVHFVYDQYSGPFTDHVPLYRLVLERVPVEVHRMMTYRGQTAETVQHEVQLTTGVKPFMQFRALKVARAEETYSVDFAVRHFKPEQYPIGCETKYDGFRVIWHKEGSKAKAFTENGTEVTEFFPTAIAELESWPVDVILDSEVEGWDGHRHIPREDTSAYVRRLKTPQVYHDTNFWANVFDCVFVDWGKGATIDKLKSVQGDISQQPLSYRQEVLSQLPFKQSTMSYPRGTSRFNRVVTLIAENPEELKADAEKVIHDSVSTEGVMFKSEKSVYSLSGQTSEWYKYKRAADIHAIVVDIQKTASPGIINVLGGLAVPADWRIPANVEMEVDGRKYLYFAKSFNVDSTKHPGIKIGAIVTFYFHNLNHYTNPDGTQYVHIYEPKFYEVRNDESRPDSAADIIDVAKKAGIYVSKAVKMQVPQTKDEVVAMRPIPMDDLPHKWVVQLHQAASLHGDVRIGVYEGGSMTHLEGFTLAGIFPPGTQARKTKVSEVKAVIAKFPSGYKFNNKPGMDGRKILAEWKAPEPIEWLTVQGVTPPGSVGATRNFPGVFAIFDHGDSLYLGAQKPYFHEFFFDGKKIDGRWVLRALVTEELSNPQDNAAFTWEFWKPIDQTPYVLGTRAKATHWIPPYGVSCLPRKIRDAVPHDLRYWMQREEVKRLEIRDQLIETWRKENKIHAGQ